MSDWTRPETPTTRTRIHVRLHDTLWELGFDVEDEVQVGPYFLDCFVRELWLGFEADGTAYHRGKKYLRDLERDDWILQKAGIPVLRVRDYDLKRSSDPETVQIIEGFVNQYGRDIDSRRLIAEENILDVGYI